MKKLFSPLVLLPILLVSCGTEQEIANSKINKKNLAPISTVEFDGVLTPTNYNDFINEVRINSKNNNNPGTYGLVYSPYYSINVNEKTKKTYAANVTNGLMSFIQVKLQNDPINLIVNYYQTINSIEIYCAGEVPTITKISNSSFQFEINEQKSYTFKVNNDLEKALTIFGEHESVFNEDNKDIMLYKAGVHDYEIVGEKNSILYFSKGIHFVRNIVLKSNSEIYLEEGAYLKCINPSRDKETPTNESDSFGCTVYKTFITAKDAENIKISGLGFIDFYQVDWHARSGINFLRVNNVTFSDFTFNNPAGWAIDIACCKNINISNVKIFGYRQNSDGICIEDSNNALIENCYARSGDDLFEVKSRYGNETLEIGQIRFNNCVAWPDKARGFGIIAETSRKINDVKYTNCVCLAYTPKWMKYLAACIIYGDGKGLITNVTFDNFSIFNNIYYPLQVSLSESSSNTVENIIFKNIYIQNEHKILVENDSNTGIINYINFEGIEYSNVTLFDKQSLVEKVGSCSNINIK